MLTQLSWVKCYELSYCDDENKRQLEYSIERIEPYPINSKEPFTIWGTVNFLKEVPCSALFLLTAVKSGEDKSKCDKNLTISMSQAFEMMKKCMGDKNTKYFCIKDPSDFGKFMTNSNKPPYVEAGPIDGCLTIPKLLPPGLYDIYLELLVSTHEVIFCYKFQEMELK
ncbi:uncharacterized protein LOC111638699 [Centruroides sculpturatus]|uniref:uncharacterized protein LOC111638699 n=1 Tax=Centruroides sculpturatus TaxID=218467 RepID=UPI000C6CADE5|nr:uncharacterized protein LOC111638699 [Centruroides sculpturatus]